MGQNNAKIIDPAMFIQAGIDRKTGLPSRLVGADGSLLKSDMKRFLRLIDEQDAINRYKWTLPKEFGLTGQEMERFLYYKGQMCFFKMEDKYYFMPYALEGGLDFYGRYSTIHPVPMTSGVDDEKYMKTPKYNSDYAYLSQKKLKVVHYEGQEINEGTQEDYAVILYDYSRQYNAQSITPRQVVNDPLIDVMACMIPYLKTCAISATGVRGVRCPDADSYKDVEWGAKNIDNCALKGQVWIPIAGSVELQELMDKTGTKMEEYMQSLQSLDNLRLSGYGLDNGGMFEKKSHILQDEQDTNNSNVSLVMEDGLAIRKRFCDLVKKTFGIEISVESNNPNDEMNLGENNDYNDNGGNNNVSNNTEL